MTTADWVQDMDFWVESQIVFFLRFMLALLAGFCIGVTSFSGVVLYLVLSATFVTLSFICWLFSTDPLMLIYLTLAVSVVTAAIGLKVLTPKEKSFLMVTGVWLCGVSAVLIGSGYYFPALVMTVSSFFLMLYWKQYLRAQERTTDYSLILEMESVKDLDVLSEMIRDFELAVERKSVYKNDVVKVEMSYRTTPLMHHLFRKRLYRLAGLEKAIFF